MNGFAVGDLKENPTCQDNTNLKRASMKLSSDIYIKLDIKSQEMVKVNIQHTAFSNKPDDYEKSKSRKEIQ